MKKFLSILLAGFIGFLGIFTTTNTFKNTAEPQYFLQNERKNAAVETGTNEYTFYFDLEVNYYSPISTSIATLKENTELYYITTNGLVNATNLVNFAVSEELTTFDFSSLDIVDDNNNYLGNANWFGLFIKKFSFNYTKDGFNFSSNIWYGLYTENFENITYYEILGFKLINLNSIESLESINNNLIPYIGNLTSLPDSDQNQNSSIEQIGNIISDTTNWFVNIFLGLSDIFYNNGNLGVWGSVLFLGVAFTLITMCLKWVISLVRRI